MVSPVLEINPLLISAALLMLYFRMSALARDPARLDPPSPVWQFLLAPFASPNQGGYSYLLPALFLRSA